MNLRVRAILADLDRIRLDLRAHADDFWLGTEYNNPQALKETYDFMQALNT